MGSQFVDFNADGHLDYITATFDGSPHVSYGSAEGFGTPERIKDAQGQRLLISSIWNYETKKHEDLGRAMPDGKARSERCISALAFDWDGDGDYDLLLGSYKGGHLYRQMNEGTNKAPKFTGKNIVVMAGDVPFALAAKMTAPRLVDWDGDGDMDLLAGSFGNSWSPKGQGGGVSLARNNGSKGKPVFGALETILAPQAKGAPSRHVRTRVCMSMPSTTTAMGTSTWSSAATPCGRPRRANFPPRSRRPLRVCAISSKRSRRAIRS